jgi:hypothetical protein
VTQEHNHLSMDGLYIDSAFTPPNAANLTRDLGFDGTISGDVYAQPLYIEGGPNGPINNRVVTRGVLRTVGTWNAQASCSLGR